MAQSSQPENVTIASTNVAQAVMQTVTIATKSTEPMARSLAQCNMAMADLLKQRARAMMETSSGMTQCKTPTDFANLHMTYWQTATQDYIDATRRMTTIFSSIKSTPHDAGNAPADNPFLSNPVVQAWATLWEKGMKTVDEPRGRDPGNGPDPKSPQPVNNGRHAA
jgi:Phasin protein